VKSGKLLVMQLQTVVFDAFSAELRVEARIHLATGEQDI